MRMEAHETCQSLSGLLFIHLRIVLDRLYQTKVGFIGGIVLEYIEDKTFVNRLPHAIEMEGVRLTVRTGCAEDLQGFVFGCCGEGKVTDVGLIAVFERSVASLTALADTVG